MNKSNIPLKDLIKIFDTYNRSDCKAPPTLRWYNGTLNIFLGWLIETDRPVTLGTVNEDTVREFVIWLKERPVNGHKMRVYSVNNRVRALRAFFNWLYRKEYTATHLLQDLKPPRLPQLMVDTLSNEEIAAIMASLDPSTATGKMLARILGSVSRQESEHKAERQRRANIQRAEAGGWSSSHRVFGYTMDGELVPDEADLVRQERDRLLH